MLTKRLPRMNVGQMHLDEGNCNRQQSIPQGHTGVCERSGVNHNKMNPFRSDCVDPFYQRVFGIALECLYLMTSITSLRAASVDAASMSSS